MHYTIYYENADSATAPATEVFVYDTIDTEVYDMSTLEFHGYGFNTTEIDFGLFRTTGSFSQDLDLRPEKNVILRISGVANEEDGTIKWSFLTFDPATMDLTEAIEDGFLPPNVNKPEGEGFVKFSIRAKSDIKHLDELANKATIVFDRNKPIETPIWSNTIDRVLPSSEVLMLGDSIVNDTNFVVSWMGNDAHAGVSFYDVYVSIDGEEFVPWLLSTSLTENTFTGEFGSTYSFYSIATDGAGNVEPDKDEKEATTKLVMVITNTVDPLQGYELHQNKPNPFSNQTQIVFELPEEKEVSFEIFDMTGKRVYSINKQYHQGRHNITWKPNAQSNGIYYYRMLTEDGAITKKMILQK